MKEKKADKVRKSKPTRKQRATGVEKRTADRSRKDKHNADRLKRHDRAYRKLKDLLALAIPLGCKTKTAARWAVFKIFTVDDLLECHAQLKTLLRLAKGTKLSFQEICHLFLAELGLKDFSLDDIDPDRALELVKDEKLSQNLPEYKKIFKDVVKNAALKKKETSPDLADAIDNFIMNELEYEDMELDDEFDFERARQSIRHHLKHAHRQEEKFLAGTDEAQRDSHAMSLVEEVKKAWYYET